MLIRKPYFNADAGAGQTGGGGGTTNPDPNSNPNPSQSPAATGGEPPAGDPAVETKEFEDLSAKGTLTDAEKARFEVLKSKYEVTFLGEDGKPLTPDQIKAHREIEAKVNAILAKPEDQRTAEDNAFLAENTEEDKPATTVYDQVNELRGVTYDIDYGDVDPASPEGIALREDHIEKQAIDGFENELRTKLPRAYQFFMHLQSGGKEDDFFKPENQDFKSIKLTKDNKGQQERIVRTALQLKGNSPIIIDTLIASLKDGGKLEEVATHELEALQAEQSKMEEAKAAKAAELKAKETKDLQSLADNVKALVNKGFDGIVIPEKERKAFLDHFAQQVDYHNGQIYRVQTIDQKELNKVMKAAYFEFKGGDLKGLVERTAKTQNAVKIRTKIKAQVTPKATGTQNKNYIPLGNL